MVKKRGGTTTPPLAFHVPNPNPNKKMQNGLPVYDVYRERVNRYVIVFVLISDEKVQFLKICSFTLYLIKIKARPAVDKAGGQSV